MTQGPLFIAAILATAAVAIILLLGIGSFAKGGETSRKYSNKLMRLRVMAQFVAVLLIVAVAYFAKG